MSPSHHTVARKKLYLCKKRQGKKGALVSWPSISLSNAEAFRPPADPQHDRKTFALARGRPNARQDRDHRFSPSSLIWVDGRGRALIQFPS